MKRATVIGMIALVWALGAALVSAERVEVKLEQDGADDITISFAGTTETIRLGELGEGEERQFDADGHTLKVRREGDSLKLTLDGRELTAMLAAPGHKSAEAYVVVDGGEGCCKGAKHVAVDRFEEGDGKVMVWVGEDGERHVFTKEIKIGEAGEGKRMIVVTGAGEGEPGTFVIKKRDGEPGEVELETLFVGRDHVELDKVTFRCPEDRTMLVLEREKATQESYACPVCGRLMEKVEPAQVNVRVITTVDDDEEEK